MPLRVRLLVGAIFLSGALGCEAGSSAPADDERPLTFEDWKAMPAEAKYRGATFERLKLGDPKLQDDRAWDKFQREVVLPARKKDPPPDAKSR